MTMSAHKALLPLFCSSLLGTIIAGVSPSAGDFISGFVGDGVYVGSVTLGGSSGPCPDRVLASLPVTVTRASRIYANGSGVYHQNDSDLNVVSLHVELADMARNVVAVSNFLPITAPFSGDINPINGNPFGAVTGVLKACNEPLSGTNRL